MSTIKINRTKTGVVPVALADGELYIDQLNNKLYWANSLGAIQNTPLILAPVAVSGSASDLSTGTLAEARQAHPYVQNGTGVAQTGDTIKLGWGGSFLKATVNTTDLGKVWTDASNLGYTPVGNSTPGHTVYLGWDGSASLYAYIDSVSIGRVWTDDWVSGATISTVLGYRPASSTGDNFSGSISVAGNVGASGNVYAGAAVFQSDGNIYMPAFGQYLSNFIRSGNGGSQLLQPNGGVSAFGYQTRAGYSGGFGGSNFNIWWDGAASWLYVDNSVLGRFAFTVSDYRIKDQVAPAGQALPLVDQLRVVNYNFKDHGIVPSDGKRHWGFIAHEVQRILPCAVNGDKDGQMLQDINVLDLLALLAKSVQELNRRVAALEAR